ncbi:class I SAM-dependent methyltransferase [Methylophilus medardicus]|uniref:Class I SAM-dependent methyltransferase n=1 Tax=Methylophilus medardicus TaxID=2588534 RepID=A0A5B8CQC3_9PROT|nr:SAM-dependent methyltransferase [Methylophilus medardicus]QDC43310.1 class I SAM-dependent methyltransferase [Methylophilus medardicus]QDC48317.1 class I SAM-dependent methyltransferase [Methylophilus medardicus]QDC52022.1 class I SAM-dependent methyltransferase [Methylophilus medardicus]
MMAQPKSSQLPALDANAQLHSDQMRKHIQQQINAKGGWISFADYMQMALYTPHLGYYSGDANKFGQAGDFVTAPEISPLFTQALAKQVGQVVQATAGDVLELGAGTGQLASDLLLHLADIGQLPQRYFILEVSANLRQRQQQTLQKRLPAALYARVQWLDALPAALIGVVVANEVLDAIPVHLIEWQAGQWLERGLSFDSGLVWQSQPLQNAALVTGMPPVQWPEGYTTEVCPAAQGLVASLGHKLQQGMMLWIDYGFPAHEYYHPQRNQGTLMCHFQHYAHDDPLINPGLQDITAHVNFTAIAETALTAGLSCAGYTTQAQFLINCGILQLLETVMPDDSARYLPMVAAVQKLLSPAEMGELFKVLALTKGLSVPLLGFVSGDKRHQL